MKKLTTIVATLTASVLIGGNALAADSIYLGDLYEKGTMCSEVNNVPVEYKDVLIDNSISIETTNSQYHRFLIGEIKVEDEKLVLHIGNGNRIMEESTVYARYIKGTLKCMDGSRFYAFNEKQASGGELNQFYFFLGLSFANSLAGFIENDSNFKNLFYVDVDMLVDKDGKGILLP